MSRSLVVTVLTLLSIGALPVFSYSRGWGYFPSGLLATLLLLVLLLWFF